MNIYLVDHNADVVAAWKVAFAGMSGIVIREGDILAVARSAIVSPSNTYGKMDGGIDRLYTEFFGVSPQEQLMDHYGKVFERDGYVPVGESVLVRTGHPRIPHLISSPTLVGANDKCRPQDAYYAMHGVLRILRENQGNIDEVYIPGLGTGVGELDPEASAEEMAKCLKHWRERYKTESV